jgi:hypothetical protein
VAVPLRMPPQEKLEQLKLLLELVVLMIAVPILLWQLVHAPRRVRDKALGRVT